MASKQACTTFGLKIRDLGFEALGLRLVGSWLLGF